MTDCEPTYSPLTEEDFGEGVKVTSVLLRSYCRSIAYLNGQIVELWDTTDPEVGKTFTPAIIDAPASRGVVLDGNNYKFNPATSDSFNDLLDTDTNIDRYNTTAYHDAANGQVTMNQTYAATNTINPTCQGPWGAYRCNQYWYIGYNKYKPYWAAPSWFADPLNTNAIPSVVRAQTFTAAATGVITSVTLNIKGTPRAEFPLIVELRTTSGGVPTTTVLGRCTFNFSQVSAGGMVAFPFQFGIPVTSGTKYAIVLRSPFTSYDNHFSIGGWGANCNANPCSNGDAFLSEDNGYTWIKYGKADKTLSYGSGSYAPVDFAYAVAYKTLTATYNTATSEYLYFKPIRTNNVSQVTLSVSDTKPTNTNIVYEVSNDFVNWHAVNAGNAWTYAFGTPTPRLWIRAALSTTDSSATPSIQSVAATMTTLACQDAYLRTKFYNPPTGVILGASIWSQLNAPVIEEPNTTVLIDIIRNTLVTEYFNLDGSTGSITLNQQPAAPFEEMILVRTADGVNVAYSEYKDYTVNYDTKVITFGSNPPAGVMKVQYYPCWIRGLTPDDFPLKTDVFEEIFATVNGTQDYTLKVQPVDPIRVVTLDDVVLVQDVDFTINPLTKVLHLNTNPGSGHELDVKYTPFLADSGLAFGYRMTRTNTVNQAYIKPNMFKYRV